MTEGELSIRDAEEPTVLEQPTTISGTNTDGALTAGNLSTPSISFTTHVTNPADTDVYIDASFTQVTAGSVAGTIDEDGKVTLSTRLRVDLDIEVEILPNNEYSCSTSPVDLTLQGVHDGGAVDLADANFSVPATPITATCPDFIANGINLQLQGSGHSISMSMTGALTPPIAPGEESVTTLAVSPDSPVDAGDEVTLTAAVAPGPDAENTAIPTGFVTFLDGPTELGLVPLDETGTAQLVTSDLVSGIRHLRARYEGSAPIYAVSTSTPVSYQVIAKPLVVVDLSAALQVGSTVDFSVEATNTGHGDTISNARLDVTVQRASGSATIGPLGANPRVTLATLGGGPPVPVPLTVSGAGVNQRLRGSLGPAAGVPLAPGGSLNASLRLGGSTALALSGNLRLTFTLVEVDSGGVITETLTQGSDDIELISANRIETVIAAGQVAIPEFGIPETPAVIPVQARAGNVVTLSFYNVGPPNVGPLTGSVVFTIDGRVIQVRSTNASSSVEWSTSLRPTEHPELLLPSDLGTGPRTLTVSYAGDARYRPATASFTFEVAGAIGPSYECRAEGTLTGRFRAQLEGRATLPTVARPGAMGLDNLGLRLHFSRSSRSLIAFSEIPADPDREIDLSFGPGGTGEATDLTEVNNTEMVAVDGSPIDHSVILTSPTGQAVVEGDPGETVDVTVDSLDFVYTEGFIGAQNSISCTPVGDPLVLGSVTVAGTTVEASPGVVGVGDDVVLKSTSLPAAPGTVEFSNGGTTIGVVPTTDGTATLITPELPAGTSEITAIFRNSTGLVPTTTSEPIDVRVVETCPDTVEVGNGAIVRLVYMELLGRCPDAAGYVFWVGRLDGGMTPEAFARSIARTPEAVGRVVDDAYRTMLDRPADSVGRAFWTGRLLAHGRYDRLLADLGASPEFWSKAGSTNTGFVARVYDRLLDRAPEQSGLDYWVGRLAAGTSPRVLILTLANLDEPLGVLVASSYGEILDRVPDAAERTAGVGHLRSTGDRSGLYAELIGRPEFSTRAQSFPEV